MTNQIGDGGVLSARLDKEIERLDLRIRTLQSLDSYNKVSIDTLVEVVAELKERVYALEASQGAVDEFMAASGVIL